MHFVTGGAFNGKRAWVKAKYPEDKAWISAYEKDSLPAPLEDVHHLVVLEGVEHWVKNGIDPEAPVDSLLDDIMKQLEAWIEWEKTDPDRVLIIIGTDISKGIVPMEREARMQRDITGWVYQRLVQQADAVDVIWYGISETIKYKNKKERL